MDKTWQGRIKKKTDSEVEDFTYSIDIDSSLYLHDLAGTAAHVVGLKKIGILDEEELGKVLAGLVEIKQKINNGSIDTGAYEDIHSLVEGELQKLIGGPALKIHTGRSRNDQIVLDEKMFCKDMILVLMGSILQLMSELTGIAEKEKETVFPAYTHLQKAQPVSLAHYMLSFYEKFARDFQKLSLTFEMCDEMPLGAAACAGSGYNIDRKLLAKMLNFKNLAANSMDIAGTRDYIIDLIYACSMVMIHLSRFCEDLIIYNSGEFSFIDIDESFCTGSSIMPQKKNPDLLELIRGKSSIVVGNLMQIMVLLKGLPSTYNRDLQEDKKILFDAVGETARSISIFTRLLGKIVFNREKIKEELEKGFIAATDMADYLVGKGESFRNSHNITGKIVRHCLGNDKKLEELTIGELKDFSPLFEDDIFDRIKMGACLAARAVDCGASPAQVGKRIKLLKKQISSFEKKLEGLKNRTAGLENIIDAVNSL